MAGEIPLPQPQTQNLGPALINGINDSRQWAQMAFTVQQRKALLQRQYDTLQNQQNKTSLDSVKYLMNYAEKIPSMPQARQDFARKILVQQGQMLGFPMDVVAQMTKEQDFKANVAVPTAHFLQSLSTKDYSGVGNAIEEIRQALGDPVKVTDLLSQATGYMKQQLASQNQGTRAANQAENQNEQMQFKVGNELRKFESGSSRNAIGGIGRTLINGDRALDTLNQPTITNQQAHNIAQDIAGMYSTGVATVSGSQANEYKTLYGNIQGIIQSITGTPEDAVPDAIKNNLITQLQRMRALSLSALKRYSSDVEATVPGFSKKNPGYFENWAKRLAEQDTPLTGDAAVKGSQAQTPSAPTLTPDQTKTISDRVKDSLSKGASPEDIRGQLLHVFPQINDMDLKAVGLPSVLPTPQQSTPNVKPSAPASTNVQPSAQPSNQVVPNDEPAPEEKPEPEEKSQPQPDLEQQFQNQDMMQGQ